MQEDFKPCPFCGSREVYLLFNEAKNGLFYYVGCGTCGGRTRGIFRDYRSVHDADTMDCSEARKAISLWERRV